MQPQYLVIEQYQIEDFEQTGTAFLRDILDMDYARVLVTDISDLSDFSFSGKLPAGTLDPEGKTLNQLYAIWDKWVLEKVRQTYGIELTTTKFNLMRLFHQIEQAASKTLH